MDIEMLVYTHSYMVYLELKHKKILRSQGSDPYPKDRVLSMIFLYLTTVFHCNFEEYQYVFFINVTSTFKAGLHNENLSLTCHIH